MDLSGYKPEAPDAGSDFQPFKYEGAVKINSARLSKSEKDTEYYPLGCSMISIEVEVLLGDFQGRKLWKRFNLDSTTADKKGKTPAMKLADQFFAVGLEFNNLIELETACSTLVEMTINIKANSAKINGEARQVWNFKGLATEKDVDNAASSASSPSTVDF